MALDFDPTKLANEAPPLSAAERMRRYRRRRRHRRFIVRVELYSADIDTLIARKYLAEDDRGKPDAIQQATNTFVSDAFCEAKWFGRGG